MNNFYFFIIFHVRVIVSELEIQSLRESDSKKKKKRHHQDKKKKKKHVHTEDTITSGDSPASDSDKESDDGKSRDGYSSPDTGNYFRIVFGLNSISISVLQKHFN